MFYWESLRLTPQGPFSIIYQDQTDWSVQESLMCKYPVTNNLILYTELDLKGGIFCLNASQTQHEKRKMLHMLAHGKKAKYDSPEGSFNQKIVRHFMPFLAITSPKTHKVRVSRQSFTQLVRSIRPSDFMSQGQGVRMNYLPRLKKSCDFMVCSESIQHHRGASYLGTIPQKCRTILCKSELETMLIIYSLKDHPGR